MAKVDNNCIKGNICRKKSFLNFMKDIPKSSFNKFLDEDFIKNPSKKLKENIVSLKKRLKDGDLFCFIQ